MTTSYEKLNKNNVPNPIPWQPSQRADIKRKLLLDNKDNEAVINYIRSIDNTFIITGVGVQAVRMAISFTSPLAQNYGNTYFTNRAQSDIQRQFEQEKLGLKPANGNDGLHYWESNAGGASGKYPIESIASFANTDVTTFERVLNDEELTRFGSVIIKSYNTLVPVVKNYGNSSDFVHAGKAMELSDHGEALLDVTLGISDYSTH